MTNPEKLKKLMDKRGLTQAAVADILGFSVNKKYAPHQRTVHRMLHEPGYESPIKWPQVFILLENKIKSK